MASRTETRDADAEFKNKTLLPYLDNLLYTAFSISVPLAGDLCISEEVCGSLHLLKDILSGEPSNPVRALIFKVQRRTEPQACKVQHGLNFFSQTLDTPYIIQHSRNNAVLLHNLCYRARASISCTGIYNCRVRRSRTPMLMA